MSTDWVERVARRRATGSAEHVLVVDDEEGVRGFAARILEAAGFRTTRAATGQEALALVQGQPTRFDAVLSDVVMPDFDGVRLLAFLADLRPDLPVLLMSGHVPSVLQARGIKPPCAFVAKPFRPHDLARLVRSCIDDQGRLRARAPSPPSPEQN